MRTSVAGIRSLKAATMFTAKGYDARALKPGFAELAAAESEEILSFDSALCRLEAESAEAAQVVRLRRPAPS